MIYVFYGRSNSGKTTLIVKLIKELKEKGYRVGAVKNIHSPNFTIDTEEKDTWKHTQAGSEIVVAHSEGETAFLVNSDMEPGKTLNIMDKISDLDIVIVEGHWDDDNPKVAIGDIEDKPNTVLRYKDNYDEILEYAVHGIEVDRRSMGSPVCFSGVCWNEFRDKPARRARIIRIRIIRAR